MHAYPVNNNMTSSLSSLKQSLREIQTVRKQYEMGEISQSHNRTVQLECELQEEKTQNLVLQAKLHEMELALAAERAQCALQNNRISQYEEAEMARANAEKIFRRQTKLRIQQLSARIMEQTEELKSKEELLQGAAKLQRDLDRAERQVSALLGKLHDLERVQLPSAMEAQANLQAEVKVLKMNLEEAMENEDALRELLKLEQDSRRRRRREAM